MSEEKGGHKDRNCNSDQRKPKYQIRLAKGYLDVGNRLTRVEERYAPLSTKLDSEHELSLSTHSYKSS